MGSGVYVGKGVYVGGRTVGVAFAHAVTTKTNISALVEQSKVLVFMFFLCVVTQIKPKHNVADPGMIIARQVGDVKKMRFDRIPRSAL